MSYLELERNTMFPSSEIDVSAVLTCSGWCYASPLSFKNSDAGCLGQREDRRSFTKLADRFVATFI